MRQAYKTTDISTKFCSSTIKTSKYAGRELHTGGAKSVIYDGLVDVCVC